MRILQVAPPWFAVPPAGYGGVEWVVAELADGLADRGHDVTLLASGGSRTRATLWSVFDEPPSKLIGSPYHDLMHCAAAYRRRGDFDLIHDHSGILGPAIGSFVDGPPVVHTLHGPWLAGVKGLYQALPPRLHLVAISHDQRARAPEGLPIAGVVPNGIRVGAYPLRTERRGTDGYLVFVGRANREKGPEVAVRVAQRLGRHLKMLVKVNEVEEEAYWRARVAPLVIDADVEVLAEVSLQEKARLVAGADACLFPIQWPEPFGLVMTEAMACGTPVVAFANGAATEVIAHGETGFLVPPGDLDAFCDAVTRVGDLDPHACRRRVEAHYSGERMVRGYEEVYERVLTQATGSGARPAGVPSEPV